MSNKNGSPNSAADFLASLAKLAHTGSSDAEIMAQLEHKSERAARIYRSQASQRLTADSGQDRIDEKIRLRALKNGVMRTDGTL